MTPTDAVASPVEGTGSAKSAARGEETADRKLERAELRWKIRVAEADVAQKVLISVIGAIIAAIFFVFQANQTESRYYSELQAQRERGDAELRASMFKTLFEVYFKNKMEETHKTAATGKQSPARAAALLVNLRQEVMLSDLLARNFETLDVRPLFEDLDRRLTELIEVGGDDQQAVRDHADQAFLEREQLRRVAIGTTTRQIELLQANAAATSDPVTIEQCQDGPSSPIRFKPDVLPVRDAATIAVVKQVADGSVTVSFSGSRQVPASAAVVEAARPPEVPVTLTFFDMPSIETVRLRDGRRLALTLTRSVSTRTCERFSQLMDETLRKDCGNLTKRAGVCARADVWITEIPKNYIGTRDRPYLSQLYNPLIDLRKLVSN